MCKFSSFVSKCFALQDTSEDVRLMTQFADAGLHWNISVSAVWHWCSLMEIPPPDPSYITAWIPAMKSDFLLFSDYLDQTGWSIFFPFLFRGFFVQLDFFIIPPLCARGFIFMYSQLYHSKLYLSSVKKGNRHFLTWTTGAECILCLLIGCCPPTSASLGPALCPDCSWKRRQILRTQLETYRKLVHLPSKYITSMMAFIAW